MSENRQKIQSARNLIFLVAISISLFVFIALVFAYTYNLTDTTFISGGITSVKPPVGRSTSSRSRTTAAVSSATPVKQQCFGNCLATGAGAYPDGHECVANLAGGGLSCYTCSNGNWSTNSNVTGCADYQYLVDHKTTCTGKCYLDVTEQTYAHGATCFGRPPAQDVCYKCELGVWLGTDVSNCSDKPILPICTINYQCVETGYQPSMLLAATVNPASEPGRGEVEYMHTLADGSVLRVTCAADQGAELICNTGAVAGACQPSYALRCVPKPATGITNNTEAVSIFDLVYQLLLTNNQFNN